MHNNENAIDFQKMMAGHNRWVMTDGLEGARADFSNLSYALPLAAGIYNYRDIAARNGALTKQPDALRNGDFAGAEIENFSFDFSDLSGADFRHVRTLKNTRFLGALTHEAKFTLTADLLTCRFHSHGAGTKVDAEFYTPDGARIEGKFTFDDAGQITFARGNAVEKLLNMMNEVDILAVERLFAQARRQPAGAEIISLRDRATPPERAA